MAHYPRRHFQSRMIILLTVIATTLAGLAALTAPAQAKVPGPNGRIAFTRTDFNTGTDMTYTINADGTGLKPLFSKFPSSVPHWSPDGTLVAVQSGLTNVCPPNCASNIVIVNPVTGRNRVVVPQGPPVVFTYCSLWSPDATQFACDGESDNDPSVNGIYTVRSSDGGGLTRLTNAGGLGLTDIPIDYSPDGRQLLFGRVVADGHSCTKSSALFVVDVSGANLHQITPGGFCDDDGSWSPDGTQIAFANGPRIYTVHPDGTGLAQVPLGDVPGASNSWTGAGDVSWSPDGTKLVFLLTVQTSPNGGFQQGIATADTNGRNVQWVTTTTLFDHEADWGIHQ